ncbi:hypothetical protein VM1G_11996 [Cytospora mali]|uniref:Uncharacterized protein n=1 Tax=Cytospora mali TaxID=578113 RepID=A0A194VHE1_CYTMA|nr:hypothetical protein VM1G_11996 [Valsa mali]
MVVTLKIGSVQSRSLRRDERSDATNAVTDIGEDNPCEPWKVLRGSVETTTFTLQKSSVYPRLRRPNMRTAGDPNKRVRSYNDW